MGLLVGLIALAAVPVAAAGTRQAAVERLAEASGQPVAVYRNPTTRHPYFVSALVPVSSFSDASTAVGQGADFWRSYGALFGVRNVGELALRRDSTDTYGVTHLRYDQRYRGLEVFGRQLLVHLRAGQVIAANGRFAGGIDVTTTPAVSNAGAAFTAVGAIPARGSRSLVGAPQLLVHVNGLDRARLAWRATVASTSPLGLWRVFVDSQTGEVLQAYNDLHTAKNRITYTNGNDLDCNDHGAPQCTLPGAQVRNEVDPPVGDAVVQETHVNTGIVYDYYSTTFGRDSYDSAGHVLRSTVHFGAGYDNAFWCADDCPPAFGSVLGGQMVYGDGSWNGANGLFSPLGQDLDVVAHELTHAVTGEESGLEYFGQAGALNESYSDVFAAMVDNDGGEWLIGEDSWTPGTPGDALRNMADPQAEGQPAHMNDYVNTVYDNGGVHTNSGIPNHAAFLAATAPGYGIGRADLQRIYYEAMPCLSVEADFLENLQCLLLAAQLAFSGDAAKAAAITRSQAAVGIAAAPTIVSPNGGEVLPAAAATTVTWAGSAATGLPFAVSLVQTAPGTYAEGFEGGALPAGFTTGTPPWFVTTSTPGTGLRSARSGPMGSNGRSELHTVIHTRQATSLSLQAWVSSEPDFDFFSVHVDGVPLLVGSGEIPWSQTPPVPIGPGAHEVVFVYETDATVVGGLNAAFVDDLRVPNAELGAVTVLTPSTAPDASSFGWVTPDGGTYRIRIRRLGVAPWLAGDESDGAFAIQAAQPPQPPPTPPAPPAPPPPPPPSSTARCVVPNVKGKTVPTARTALGRARCALGRVSRAYSRRVRKGRIVSQSRRPGTRAPRGTRVNVVVSRGRRR